MSTPAGRYNGDGVAGSGGDDEHKKASEAQPADQCVGHLSWSFWSGETRE